MELKKSPQADLEKNKGIFFQLGLIFATSLILIAFEWTTQPQDVEEKFRESKVAVEEEIIPITRQQQQQPPPPEPPKVTEVLEIVENEVEVDDDLNINTESDENLSIDLNAFNIEDENVAEEEVFVIVEDMPKFQGKGPDAFRAWIAQNMVYPPIAAENLIQGTVFVQFAINSKGEVVDVKVVRGVDPSLDAEALRVIKASPKWEPGKQRGKAVKVQFTFPIRFVLN